MQIGPKYCVSPIKHEDMCDYNPKCFMSGGLILDDIIMNILSETSVQEMSSVKIIYFAKIKDD